MEGLSLRTGQDTKVKMGPMTLRSFHSSREASQTDKPLQHHVMQDTHHDAYILMILKTLNDFEGLLALEDYCIRNTFRTPTEKLLNSNHSSPRMGLVRFIQ